LRPDSRSTASISTRMARSVLDASSVGRTALSRLNAGRGEGVVYGVFDGAINLLLSGGLICLVPEGGEKGPLNLSVRLPVGQGRMSSLGIGEGDTVFLAGSSLELGDRYRVRFGGAPVYSPERGLPGPLLDKRGIGGNLDVVKRAALLHGNMAGLGGLLAMAQTGRAMPRPYDLNIFASAALPRVIRLERALRADRRGALTDAVRGLVGLGPGLTPSSDDMLTALVLVCVLHSESLGGENGRPVPIAQAIASLPPGKTTLLSEEFLRQAASGMGNERVVRLCSAVLTGGRESVERETERVLGIGETSGTDAALGVVLGALFCLGRRPGLESGRSQ
jgi:hypothetical protein